MVKLISYTQINPNGPLASQLGEDASVQDLIAYCARVSNPSNQSNQKTGEKLIKHLIENKHWSPLEMVSACLEINTTRDIARQILRHRSFQFQEFSQRYADPTKDLEFVIREARMQDPKNRQNSVEITNFDGDQGLQLKDDWAKKQKEVIALVQKHYSWAVSNGIAKEQARAILPEGNTGSRLYMSGTLRSFVHYIEVRSGNGTQREHMLIARQVAAAISPIFPLIKDILMGE